jgi:transcriptional regulator with XRE-family HTH domain
MTGVDRIQMTPARAYCVYLHRAGETVFYVGRGRPTRPFDTTARHPVWQAFVKTLVAYDVEIVLWTDDYEEAALEESRLIAFWHPVCNQSRAGESRKPVWKHRAAPLGPLGANIRKYRMARGLSVEQLGKLVGYANATMIYKMEKGLKEPSAQKLEDLARILEVSSSDLIGDVPLTAAFEARLRTIIREELDARCEQLVQDMRVALREVAREADTDAGEGEGAGWPPGG